MKRDFILSKKKGQQKHARIVNFSSRTRSPTDNSSPTGSRGMYQ
jgi:hypothetical protein